jgi:hypothetical protein
MAKPQFEQDLVSMVSSLVHLRTIGEELRKKPFAIPRMEAALRDSLSAFADLTSSFERTEETLQRDAQPYLEQWLAARGLQLGGEARVEGSSGLGIARVRGRLSVVRLSPKLIFGKRSVELILEDASFSVGALPGYAPFETLGEAQLSPVLNGIHGVRIPVTREGYRGRHVSVPDELLDRHVVRICLPIKQDDIASLARSIRLA